MEKRKFSLVVTCYNEMRSLGRWKQDILNQTRQPDEIVIVDSDSKDGTTEILRAWASEDPKVRVIVEKCKPARGHNIGNGAASHDIILSTDMGVRLAPVWCQELIRPFENDPTVEVVAGSTQIDRETVKSAAARAEYYIENGGFAKLGPGFVVGNRSVAYLKRVWCELGGLPEDLTFYADDSVFGRQVLQAGYKMAFAPEAMTYWGRPENLRQFWKEQFNYGRGDGEADIKTPCAFRWYKGGRFPLLLVPVATALRALQLQLSGRAAWQAATNLDLLALAVMPILLLGRGYCFAKGYILGYRQGLEKCQACRVRLKRPLAF